MLSRDPGRRGGLGRGSVVYLVKLWSVGKMYGIMAFRCGLALCIALLGGVEVSILSDASPGANHDTMSILSPRPGLSSVLLVVLASFPIPYPLSIKSPQVGIDYMNHCRLTEILSCSCNISNSQPASPHNNLRFFPLFCMEPGVYGNGIL